MRAILMASVSLVFCGAVTSAVAQALPAPDFGFAPDAGLMASFLLLEGSGTVLHDNSPLHNNISLGTSCVSGNWTGTPAVPTWTADGGLQFGTGSAYQCLPASVQNIQTVEISFGSAVQWQDTSQPSNPSPSQPGLFGYNGAAPAPSLLLSTGYTGNSVGGQGYATTYVGSYMSGDGSGVSTTGTVDGGRHTLIMEISPTTGARTIWLDGILQPVLSGSFSNALPATSGGTWSFGGTSLGTFNTGWGQNGYLGVIYGARFSTTALSPQQIAQDTAAWTHKAEYAGSRPPSSYGPTISSPYLFTMGESWTHGYGLPNQQTQAFTWVARNALSAASGVTWKADTDGIDSASAYSADTHCRSLFPALALGVHGPKFALFYSNGNDERGYNIWPAENTSTDAGIASTAYHSLSSMGGCAAIARSNGWVTILGTENSSGNGGQGADPHQKDITNPIWRAGARQYFDMYFDNLNDPRMGADGAATTHSASGDTSCTLGGTAGPMFQNGAVHASVCGNDVVGQDLALLIRDWIGSHNGTTPDTISATTATMLLADAGNLVQLTGNGATYTLLQCGGQMQGETLVTLKNAGTGTDTILPGAEPDGGPADTMNGGSSGFSLPAGKTASFVVTRGTDAAGTCGIVSSS